jgi:hypothetical protein
MSASLRRWSVRPLADPPTIAMADQHEEIRIACAASVLRFEPGHSRIPGVLDCNDAGRKLGGGSILVDDLAELLRGRSKVLFFAHSRA